jgi:ribonuclease HI
MRFFFTWYTDGSKMSLKLEGIDLIGAGVFNDQHNVLFKIDPLGHTSTNTITRAELVAILVTLQQIEESNTDQIIATDSQACIYVHDTITPLRMKCT